MDQPGFIQYTSGGGYTSAVAAADIARIEHTTDGSMLIMRLGSPIQTLDSVETVLARLDALREAATALTLTDGVTAPGATIGVAKIYVDTADGDLKVVFSDGTVKTIVVDT